jgi:hypothetical protein
VGGVDIEFLLDPRRRDRNADAVEKSDDREGNQQEKDSVSFLQSRSPELIY